MCLLWGIELELKEPGEKARDAPTAASFPEPALQKRCSPSSLHRAPATTHTVEPPRLARRGVALGARGKSKMIIPNEIMFAARDGDTQTVVRFLDAGGDVNAVDAHGSNLLLQSLLFSKVELCRELVARGADPNGIANCTMPLLWVAAYVAHGGVSKLHQGGGAEWSTSPSGELFKILVESGADLNASSSFPFPDVTKTKISQAPFVYDKEGYGPLLHRLLLDFGTNDNNSWNVEIVTTLLRAGARPEYIVVDLTTGSPYTASWCLDRALADRPELAHDEHFIKTRELIVGVQEDGSFKRYVRRPHRAVLRLRSLFSRGRATPPCAIRCRRLRCYGAARQDYAMEFLVKLPDNGILWNILSFWRASE